MTQSQGSMWFNFQTYKHSVAVMQSLTNCYLVVLYLKLSSLHNTAMICKQAGCTQTSGELAYKCWRRQRRWVVELPRHWWSSSPGSVTVHRQGGKVEQNCSVVSHAWFPDIRDCSFHQVALLSLARHVTGLQALAIRKSCFIVLLHSLFSPSLSTVILIKRASSGEDSSEGEKVGWETRGLTRTETGDRSHCGSL